MKLHFDRITYDIHLMDGLFAAAESRVQVKKKVRHQSLRPSDISMSGGLTMVPRLNHTSQDSR